MRESGFNPPLPSLSGAASKRNNGEACGVQIIVVRGSDRLAGRGHVRHADVMDGDP
jgi:hypothetical protein